MKRLLLLLVLFSVFNPDSHACTSAIVASERSSEGVPMLWKHRDSKFDNTRVEYIAGGKYAYTAIVPNNRRYKTGVFAGINEKGLGVITTATRHLPKASSEEWEACDRKQIKGSLSCRALRECATIDEFEAMLRDEKRKIGFTSNLGIADATGAVAYFEIWDLGYRRYDVGKSGNRGFDVRSNFSHVGDPNKKGASKRRYDLIMKEMTAHKGDFSPWNLIGYSRSYNSIKYGDVLAMDKRYFCQNHTVPRHSTVGAFVVVCDGDNPRMLVMNGHSASSLAVPVYVKAKQNIPECVHGSTMRNLSNDFRKKAYRHIDSNHILLNKEFVRKVLNVRQPKITMPREMPRDIYAFNARIDKRYISYEKRLRKLIDKEVYPPKK